MENDRSNMYLEVRNIEANGRQWLEHILRRPLADEEQVYIVVFEPGIIPDDDTRRAAFEEMNAILDKAHRNAELQGITAEEADAAVEEAMDAIRHRKN